MSTLGPSELLIIAAVVLVLFGSKKLPDAARSMGQSMRIFRAETSGRSEEDDDTRQQRAAVGEGASSHHES